MSNTEQYVPAQYSLREFIAAARSRHEVKARGRGLYLGGKNSAPFNDMFQKALYVAKTMMDTHTTWIEEKIGQMVPYFVNEPREDHDGTVVSEDPCTRITEAFYNGLRLVLIQEYKVAKDPSPSNRFDERRLETIIVGYAVDFHHTFRVCQSAGVTPKTALQIAKLSCRHDPHILTELSANPRYQNLSQSVILRAVIYNSRDPNKFLDWFIGKIRELTSDSRYKHLNQNVISVAVIGHTKKPEEFLDWFIGKIAEFTSDPRYQDLSPSVIERAVLQHTKNPEEYLDWLIGMIAKFTVDPRYQDLHKSVICEAVRSHTKNPEEFLNWIIKKTAALTVDPRYQKLSKSIIERAVLSHTQNPEEFLDWLIGKIAEFTSDPRYEELSESGIKVAALHAPRRPNQVNHQVASSYQYFWKEFKEKNMESSALKRGKLTKDEIYILRLYFEESGTASRALLEKFTYVVANIW